MRITRGSESSRDTWLPPLLAGEGWGGVRPAMIRPARAYPLPASPCKQGEEQIYRANKGEEQMHRIVS